MSSIVFFIQAIAHSLSLCMAERMLWYTATQSLLETGDEDEAVMSTSTSTRRRRRASSSNCSWFSATIGWTTRRRRLF